MLRKHFICQQICKQFDTMSVFNTWLSLLPGFILTFKKLFVNFANENNCKTDLMLVTMVWRERKLSLYIT